MNNQEVANVAPESITEKVLASKDSFGQMLPAHMTADKWTRLVASELRLKPDLLQAAQASPATLWGALQEAAQLGLQPGTDEYYLTPRRDHGKPIVLGMIGYQGQIELMFRAGAVSSVVVETVHANDQFSWIPGQHERPVHEVDWFGQDRGPVRGAYAYAVMAGTGAISKVVVIGPAEIERAKSASATANKSSSPWKTDYPAMVKKTAVHQLAKWVPTSAEFRVTQLEASMQAAANVERNQTTTGPPETAPDEAAPATGVDQGTGEIHDAELVDEVEAMDPGEEPAR